MAKLPDAADLFVPYLPGQPDDSRSIIQFAGHLPSHPPSSRGPPSRKRKRAWPFASSQDQDEEAHEDEVDEAQDEPKEEAKTEDEQVEEDDEHGDSPGDDSPKGPDAHLFFWLVKARHVADRQRLVIWLNGGPGCSSLDGGLMEIGPFKVADAPLGAEPKLEVARYAWTEYANVVFIDQPAGTGYSYVNVGDDVRELQQAADQVVVFLQNFYRVFPEMSRMDTYLAGESYAGQYIPYIASSILETTTLPTPLKGMLMGNPWIDPYTQYASYLDFAYDRGIVKKKSKQGRKAAAAWKTCNQALGQIQKGPAKEGDEQGLIVVDVCEVMLGTILEGGDKKVDGKVVRPVSYNITQYQRPGTEWPLQVAGLTRYLDRADVVKAFHASGKSRRWTQCNNTVGAEMRSPLSSPSVALLPSLLSPTSPLALSDAVGIGPPKLRMLVYAGMQDFMCSGLGVNRTLEKLEWGGATGWNDPDELKGQSPEPEEDQDEKTEAEEGEDRTMVGPEDDEQPTRRKRQARDPRLDTGPREWWVDGRKIGSWRERNGVSYVEFDAASHMVPIDEPAASLDMLLRFLDIRPLTSAGPSSVIPSHLGSDADRNGVLGALHPNGSVLTGSASESIGTDSPFHSGDGLEDDQRAEVDKNRTAYYGPRRTTTLVLVLLAMGAGAWILLKINKARKRRRSSGGARLNGKSAIKLDSPRPSRKRRPPRSSGRSGLGRYANPSEAALLKHDAAEERDEDEMEMGVRRSLAAEREDAGGATDEDPDLAGDIGFSSKRKENTRDGVVFDGEEEGL